MYNNDLFVVQIFRLLDLVQLNLELWTKSKSKWVTVGNEKNVKYISSS